MTDKDLRAADLPEPPVRRTRSPRPSALAAPVDGLPQAAPLGGTDTTLLVDEPPRPEINVGEITQPSTATSPDTMSPPSTDAEPSERRTARRQENRANKDSDSLGDQTHGGASERPIPLAPPVNLNVPSPTAHLADPTDLGPTNPADVPADPLSPTPADGIPTPTAPLPYPPTPSGEQVGPPTPPMPIAYATTPPWPRPYMDYPYAPSAKVKKPYPMTVTDNVFALVMVVMGYLAWNWLWPREVADPNYMESFAIFFPSLAVPLFVALALGCSLTYYSLHKVKLSRNAVVGAVLLLAGSLPFALYDLTPVHFFAGLGLMGGYAIWHGHLGRTSVSTGLDALVAADLINQGLVVPLTNLGAWPASVRSLARDRKRPTQLIIAVVSLVIAIPLFAVVLMLLISADTRFGSWMNQIGQALANLNVWTFLWQLCLGVPVAMLMFALAYGNANRRGTDTVTAEGAHKGAESVRRLHWAAVATPTLVLCLIYVVFFAAMGSYLFSAFGGDLPASVTYAEYARQGFFQLAAVAAINLGVLGFTYLFTRRDGQRHPGIVRIPGLALTVLTLLLITTAISKMLLYMDQYGLTRLRVYVLWFMLVMFIVFVLLAIWQVRPFRVSSPIALVCVLSFLVLAWGNTDGMIADWNVGRYLEGHMRTIDVDYLRFSLSDAAVPALSELSDQAPDYTVRWYAAEALSDLQTYRTDRPWTAWNWQTHQANQILAD